MGAAPSNTTVEMQPKVYSLKCKNSLNNDQFVIDDLTSDSTFEHLLERVGQLMKIPAGEIALTWGFPLKEQTYERGTKLGETTLNKNEVLMVKKLSTTNSNRAPVKSEVATAPRSSVATSVAHSSAVVDAFLLDNLSGGFLARRQVPANNSCLFTSINYLLNEEKLDLQSAWLLRKQIASVIEDDPQKYDEAFLGKPNGEYCRWIQQDESWGGAIEIAILCELLKMEIDVIDVAAGCVTRFAQNKPFRQRMFLYYDMVHYDPVVYEFVDGEKRAECLFATNDSRVLELASELAKEAHSTRDFTDVQRMTMRCLDCNKMFEQPREAHEHASMTGHQNFTETR